MEMDVIVGMVNVKIIMKLNILNRLVLLPFFLINLNLLLNLSSLSVSLNLS